jgi:site-specific recombinase XerD
MPRTTTETPIVAEGPTLQSTADYGRRHLRAEGKSDRTQRVYLDALARLDRFLGANGMPRTLTGVRREHIESWINHEQDRGSAPASVSLWFRAVRPFWRWLVDEDEINRSPMEKMSVPSAPVDPPPVLTDEQAARLFATVKGTDFEARRDNAILRLFFDTGIRRGELAQLTLGDLDLRDDVAYIKASTSKSRRGRAVPFGEAAGKAIVRYLRHPRAPKREDEPLWLSRTGEPLQANSILQMVRRRGQQAAIPDLHPHIFRHTWASVMLGPIGMSEGDVMRLGGWSTRDMLSRYGASAADERARNAYRGKAPGDRLTRKGRP